MMFKSRFISVNSCNDDFVCKTLSLNSVEFTHLFICVNMLLNVSCVFFNTLYTYNEFNLFIVL